MRKVAIAVFLVTLVNRPSLAQYAERGLTVPITVSGGVVVSDRARASDPEANSVSAGFRAVLYPSLKLSSNWFVYSAIDIHSKPFFYYETFYPQARLRTDVQQMFLGYSRTGENSAIVFKAGELPSAFGAFPVRYDATANPLLDQPMSYAYPVKLRPDQLPCGVNDLIHQREYPAYVNHYCGGSTGRRGGMVPTTLYGLPGVELAISWRRLDARVQFTNSSPTNPQSLASDSQYLQWAAGAGYTVRQGFRIGMSAFRGPFLEKSVRSLLPGDTQADDYPASGIGVDVEWARGRWSIRGEWQKFEFCYPRFSISPAMWLAYAELKAILTPRVYAAFRGGLESHGYVRDLKGVESEGFLPNRQSYELALGYHLNSSHTIKVGYEWLKTEGVAGGRDNVFGVGWVTSFESLSKPF